jgi:hypothetical protein
MKITPDDGEAETLAQIFTFQITLWTVVKNSMELYIDFVEVIYFFLLP